MARKENVERYAQFLSAATTGLLAGANFKSLKSEDLADIANIAIVQADAVYENYARWLTDGLPVKSTDRKRPTLPGDGPEIQ